MLKQLHRISTCLFGFLLLVIGSSLLAHGPHSHTSLQDTSASIWTAWTFPPLVTLNLIIAAAIYATGLCRLWEKAGTGNVIRTRQAASFATGIFVLVLALLSPIDALSDKLGWMHMIQHMLLMNIAAPLLVLGAPGIAFIWMLPLSWRHGFGSLKKRGRPGKILHHILWQPLILWSLFAATLWIWHLPALYERALHNELFHDFQHFTFLMTACLFWRILLDPISRLRLPRAGAVMYLFFTSLHATMLGVFMTLAPSVWYQTYKGRTEAWNVSPLQDQQLAGLIMWMPACMAYAIVAAISLTLWLDKKTTH